MSKWIDINSELPKSGCTVLICNDGVVDCAVYDDADGFSDCVEQYMHFRHVTHWMPLPEPPKAEE